MKGKIIVIDGIDGAGKATQSTLLANRFAKEGIATEKIDFPRYGTPVFGEFLAECLAGKHGDFAHLDPKIAATLYALDRHEAREQINAWLSEGKVVIADRYSSSNQIHQGGKIVDIEKRAAFLKWVETMEHDTLGVPRPDAVIYLRVTVPVSAALLSKARIAKNPALAEAGKDAVEKDRMYVERSFESAERLSADPLWHRVECVSGDAIRTPEEIHEDVYRIAKGILQ